MKLRLGPVDAPNRIHNMCVYDNMTVYIYIYIHIIYIYTKYFTQNSGFWSIITLWWYYVYHRVSTDISSFAILTTTSPETIVVITEEFVGHWHLILSILWCHGRLHLSQGRCSAMAVAGVCDQPRYAISALAASYGKWKVKTCRIEQNDMPNYTVQVAQVKICISIYEYIRILY